MAHPILQFSPRINCLPIVHGSGDYAVEVRRLMLNESFDCLAVPLPPSFQEDVEAAIGDLPRVSVVIQREPQEFAEPSWQADHDDADGSGEDFDADENDPRSRRRDGDSELVGNYVPIDPCQGVIAGLRIAIGERLPRAFIDLETSVFEPSDVVLPDPYALKQVAPEKFAAAVLPNIPRPMPGQRTARITHMASRLRDLERRYQRILFICSLTDWPWIREAYVEKQPAEVADDPVEESRRFPVATGSLAFFLGELPFITALYEQARADLEEDENLSIDGIKALLLAARDHYRQELGRRARTISPKLLRTYLQYVRNLSLVERRMTPSLYTLVIAAQQMAGDHFAISLAQVARQYLEFGPEGEDEFWMGIGRGRLPDGSLIEMKNRLAGQALEWRTCQLKPQPPKPKQLEWQTRWNPYRQCSWPPEDVAIEKFRTHVKDVALTLLGTDLARSEKFSTSLKDGLDIRETLRNWHTGDLYVKVLPPTRGTLDCVLMLFDSPADPRDYPWRVTWHAEHHDESTLALFATDFHSTMVGPGIGQAVYGGGVFLFPPRPIPDVWTNPRLDFADTMEERLLGAACMHARERHVALLSAAPPGAAWRAIAKRFGKRLIHIPLSRFSQEMIQQLRIVHVLNGQHIRSFAADFIRKA